MLPRRVHLAVRFKEMRSVTFRMIPRFVWWTFIASWVPSTRAEAATSMVGTCEAIQAPSLVPSVASQVPLVALRVDVYLNMSL